MYSFEKISGAVGRTIYKEGSKVIVPRSYTEPGIMPFFNNQNKNFGTSGKVFEK